MMLRVVFVAAGLCHVLATCAPSEAGPDGACLAEEVGDETAALQVKVGGEKQQRSEHAPIELIPIVGVEDHLPWREHAKGNPECMQGVVWMDQSCIATEHLPKDQQLKPCGGRIAAQNEYTTSFGQWNASSKCFTFRRDSWTLGKFYPGACEKVGPSFCMMPESKRRGDGPCTLGALFEKPNSIYQVQVTKFGFDRITHHGHYNLLHIVDKDGNRTKWYDMYAKSAQDGGCPRPGLLTGCQGPVQEPWRSEGKLAHCVGPFSPRSR